MENKQNIKDLIHKFYPHAKEKLGFDHPVRVIMRQDAENAQQSLGKTAYYDPAEKLIVLYVTNRHPKDILRSFSHELVHHAQNCRGELDDLTTGGHYAKDGKGREIEEEAYLQGNLNLRDYEDSIKFKGVNEMKLTKSQLKGLIEQTIEKITEKKFPDLTGDGKVTQADILKGRGVSLSADERKKFKDELAAKINDKNLRNKLKEEEPVEEQEALTISPEGAVELPEDVQRFLDDIDSQLASMEEEDKQVIKKLITRLALKKAGVDVASPELDVDEMHCGGKRDDELEENKFMDKVERAKEILKKLVPLGYNADAITKEDVQFLMDLINPMGHNKGSVQRGGPDFYGKIHKYKDQDDKEIKVRTIDETDELEEQEAQSAPPKKIVPPKDNMKRPYKKAVPPKKDQDQIVVTPRSEEEKEEERKKKEEFKKNNPEFSTALDSIRLKENNETWYNSSLYESLKSKWTK